jgi:GDP-L-fucose synthase
MKLNKKLKIYVAGHNGMVGSAMLRSLKSKGYENLLFKDRKELDLTNQSEVESFFRQHKPEVLVDCAAKVGGIHSNNVYRAEFIYNNLQIQNNLIHCSHTHGVKKLLFLGSVCIYPKFVDQPIKEEYLLRSPLEPTNDAYAIAKIAGIKMCESYHRQYGSDFFSVMPANLYGENDNFHPENSHVLPALIRRFHEAKESKLNEVCVWGTGQAMREFMHVNDLADACVYILENISSKEVYPQGIAQLNIGTGKDISIKDLAALTARTIGYKGETTFDLSKPDGTLKRVLDSSRLEKLGWRHSISLEEGLALTYSWFKKQNAKDLRQI